MGLFEAAYQKLNEQQRQAVDQTDGPVQVIAGPGTGKTQLLALRVANILKSTDTLPNSILCLTFTESAQATMLERLVGFIGEAAYGVSVQTFHGFAGEVLARYPEYFDDQPHTVADNLITFEIMQELFTALPHGHPLSVRDGDSFVHLSSVKTRISQLKQAGLSVSELREIIAQDQASLEKVSPQLHRLEASIKPALKAVHIPAYQEFLEMLTAKSTDNKPLHGFEPILQLAGQELADALEQCRQLNNKTSPLTIWRRKWLTTTKEAAVFKDVARLEKLSATADLYEAYQNQLKLRSLRDFDDLILQLIAKLQVTPDLQAALQEQFQYILVDEYQDTNGSQQDLLEILADNAVNEDRPNLMVVGDDDQAIYGFQGASPTYMRRFAERWRSVVRVTLEKNYRSTPEIVNFSRAVIEQAAYHQADAKEYIVKTLRAEHTSGSKPVIREFSHLIDLYWGLAEDIQKRIAEGLAPQEIAIIAPRHRRLAKLVPYLLDKSIPINYERRDNVLQQPHIEQLILLAKTVQSLADDNLKLAESLLPRLVSLPFWGISTTDLWQLQLSFHQNKSAHWLEHARQSSTKLSQIVIFLLAAARASLTLPLEGVLDILLGNEVIENERSPFRNFYFSDKQLAENPAHYVTMLSSLNTLRRRVEQWRPASKLSLKELLTFIELVTQANEQIVDNHPLVLGQDSVNLLTAHRAKGQEFSLVYLLEADQANWVSDRGRPSTIGLPPNLPIQPESDTTDEKLRRFYVSATRAANELIMCRSLRDDSGKSQLPLMWLTPDTVDSLVTVTPETGTSGGLQLSHGLSLDWRSENLYQLQTDTNLRTVLASRLQSYHLSASHLNTWLDLQYGGPKVWLTDKLLGFPHQAGPDAAYGTAIHNTLERQHILVGQGQAVSIEVALHDFERFLQQEPIDELAYQKLLDRGKAALPVFLASNEARFTTTQRAEYNVPQSQVVLGSARVYGKIDLIDVDTKAKTVIVTDYKTGRSFSDWQPKDSSQRQKLHAYRRQLIFYKLLLENSREFHDYTVTTGRLSFVEPDDNGAINTLELTFSDAEVGEVQKLIAVIWRDIMSLNLPEVTTGSATASRNFEKQLLEENS